MVIAVAVVMDILIILIVKDLIDSMIVYEDETKSESGFLKHRMNIIDLQKEE